MAIDGRSYGLRNYRTGTACAASSLVMALVDTRLIGRRGGLARAAKMTPAARSAAARKAVQARWDRQRAKVRTEHILRSPAS
mgnify:CR=1 FL=1